MLVAANVCAAAMFATSAATVLGPGADAILDAAQFAKQTFQPRTQRAASSSR